MSTVKGIANLQSSNIYLFIWQTLLLLSVCYSAHVRFFFVPYVPLRYVLIGYKLVMKEQFKDAQWSVRCLRLYMYTRQSAVNQHKKITPHYALNKCIHISEINNNPSNVCNMWNNEHTIINLSPAVDIKGILEAPCGVFL